MSGTTLGKIMGVKDDEKVEVVGDGKGQAEYQDDAFSSKPKGDGDGGDGDGDDGGDQTGKKDATFAEHLKGGKEQAASEFAMTKTIDEQRRFLPIWGCRSALLTVMRDNNVVILVGETGSGKTTQIAQYLHEDGLTAFGMVGHAAAAGGGDVGGEARERGDGRRAGEGGGVRDPLRGHDGARDAAQVHDRRRAAARDAHRARPRPLRLRHHGRGPRARPQHRRALRAAQEGGGAAARLQADRHQRDDGRRQVLRLLRQRADLQDPGAHVPRRRAVREDAVRGLRRGGGEAMHPDPPVAAGGRCAHLHDGAGGHPGDVHGDPGAVGRTRREGAAADHHPARLLAAALRAPGEDLRQGGGRRAQGDRRDQHRRDEPHRRRHPLRHRRAASAS